MTLRVLFYFFASPLGDEICLSFFLRVKIFFGNTRIFCESRFFWRVLCETRFFCRSSFLLRDKIFFADPLWDKIKVFSILLSAVALLERQNNLERGVCSNLTGKYPILEEFVQNSSYYWETTFLTFYWNTLQSKGRFYSIGIFTILLHFVISEEIFNKILVLD